MRLAFHSNNTWRKSNDINIDQWRKRSSILILNTIIANQEYPENTQHMCGEILKDCKKQIFKRVYIPFVKTPNYGNHVIYALGHPLLKKESMEAAIKLQAINLNKYPRSVTNFIKAIVEDKEYSESTK